MHRRRSIRTTNEGRVIQAKSETPPPAPVAAVAKEAVQELNQVLPKPKPKPVDLKQLVAQAQKTATEANKDFKLGKGINPKWVDSQYGGVSAETWKAMVQKHNELQQKAVEQLAAATLKIYSGGEYPLPTTISPPPGYKPHVKPEPPPGAIAGAGTDISKLDTTFLVEQGYSPKIQVDPDIPKDTIIVTGADGKPVIIQLQ